MDLQEYIQYALNKKRIEYHSFDPRAIYQCVDLANDYIDKVWGLKAIIGTNAKDFPERLNDGMEFVKNTVNYLPEAGEIAVWNGKVGGGDGHIAIVTRKGLQTVFYSLDQNWSKPLFIAGEKHNYTNVRGFIKKIKNAESGKTYTQAEWQAERDERNKNWNLYQEAEKKADDYKDRISELEGEVAGAKTRANTEKENYQRLLDKMSEKLDCVSDEGSILEQVERDVAELDSMGKKAKELEKALSSLESEKKAEIDDLKREIDQLKNDNDRQSKRIDTLEKRVLSLGEQQEQITFLDRVKELVDQLLGKKI